MAVLAAALTLYPENPTMLSLEAINNFNGVKRRQELLIDYKRIKVLEDFAHHPTAIEQTLESLRCRYPDHKITVGFEPRSNTSRSDVFQQEFTRSLSAADQVMIGVVHEGEGGNLLPDSRLNTTQLAAELTNDNICAQAFSSNLELLESLWDRTLEAIDQDQVIILFTNGSFDGIIPQFVKRIENI